MSSLAQGIVISQRTSHLALIGIQCVFQGYLSKVDAYHYKGLHRECWLKDGLHPGCAFELHLHELSA